MARFIAGCRGNRNAETRLGSKTSGAHSFSRGRNIGGSVDVYTFEDDKDRVAFRLDGGSNGMRESIPLGVYTEDMSAEAVAVELVTAAAAILRRSYNEPDACKLSDRLLTAARAIERATS